VTYLNTIFDKLIYGIRPFCLYTHINKPENGVQVQERELQDTEVALYRISWPKSSFWIVCSRKGTK